MDHAAVPVIRFLLLWGPALAQMAVIFVASSVPNLSRLPGGLSDKLGHFVGYALLSALLVRALAAGRWAGVTWRAAVVAWGVSAAYGASDEWHQRFVPGRSTSWLDLSADALGAAAAAVVLAATATVIERRRKSRAV
jgi:VanZ family protein